MKVSVCITINNRSIQDLTAVFGTMKEQAHDEFIIVLDRPSAGLADYCKTFWNSDKRVRFVEIVGEQGWRSPVKAWNRGFQSVTGDLIYCFSSETTQKSGNIKRAKELSQKMDSVIQGKAICSCGPEGREVTWRDNAPGNLLCDAAHPRPLGFIWAAPMEKVRSIGGFDDDFADGFCYDDDDFFIRLWNTGLNFVFDDSIHGVHLHHERPVLATAEGQAGMQRNAALMQKKHGTLVPWQILWKTVEHRDAKTIWRHV